MTNISVDIKNDLLIRFHSIGFVDFLKPEHVEPINKIIFEVLSNYKLTPILFDILYFKRETKAIGTAHLGLQYKSCSKLYWEERTVECEKIFKEGFATNDKFDFKLSGSSPGDLVVIPDSFSYGAGHNGPWDSCSEHLILDDYPLVWKKSCFLIRSYPRWIYLYIDNLYKTCKVSIPLVLEEQLADLVKK